MQTWASAGGKTGICPPLKIGTKKITINGIIIAVTVYLSVLHSHCTRHRFMVLVLCRSDLAVHSWALCVAELGSGFFCCWSLLCNNIMAANLVFTSSQGCLVGLLGPNFRILVPNNTCWPQNFRLALWPFFGPFPG